MLLKFLNKLFEASGYLGGLLDSLSDDSKKEIKSKNIDSLSKTTFGDEARESLSDIGAYSEGTSSQVIGVRAGSFPSNPNLLGASLYYICSGAQGGRGNESNIGRKGIYNIYQINSRLKPAVGEIKNRFTGETHKASDKGKTTTTWAISNYDISKNIPLGNKRKTLFVDKFYNDLLEQNKKVSKENQKTEEELRKLAEEETKKFFSKYSTIKSRVDRKDVLFQERLKGKEEVNLDFINLVNPEYIELRTEKDLAAETNNGGWYNEIRYFYRMNKNEQYKATKDPSIEGAEYLKDEYGIMLTTGGYKTLAKGRGISQTCFHRDAGIENVKFDVIKNKIKSIGTEEKDILELSNLIDMLDDEEKNAVLRSDILKLYFKEKEKETVEDLLKNSKFLKEIKNNTLPSEVKQYLETIFPKMEEDDNVGKRKELVQKYIDYYNAYVHYLKSYKQDLKSTEGKFSEPSRILKIKLMKFYNVDNFVDLFYSPQFEKDYDNNPDKIDEDISNFYIENYNKIANKEQLKNILEERDKKINNLIETFRKDEDIKEFSFKTLATQSNYKSQYNVIVDNYKNIYDKLINKFNLSTTKLIMIALANYKPEKREYRADPTFSNENEEKSSPLLYTYALYKRLKQEFGDNIIGGFKDNLSSIVEKVKKDMIRVFVIYPNIKEHKRITEEEVNGMFFLKLFNEITGQKEYSCALSTLENIIKKVNATNKEEIKVESFNFDSLLTEMAALNPSDSIVYFLCMYHILYTKMIKYYIGEKGDGFTSTDELAKMPISHIQFSKYEGSPLTAEELQKKYLDDIIEIISDFTKGRNFVSDKRTGEERQKLTGMRIGDVRRIKVNAKKYWEQGIAEIPIYIEGKEEDHNNTWYESFNGMVAKYNSLISNIPEKTENISVEHLRLLNKILDKNQQEILKIIKSIYIEEKKGKNLNLENTVKAVASKIKEDKNKIINYLKKNVDEKYNEANIGLDLEKAFREFKRELIVTSNNVDINILEKHGSLIDILNKIGVEYYKKVKENLLTLCEANEETVYTKLVELLKKEKEAAISESVNSLTKFLDYV
jgi:hypothetical protein